MKYWVRRSVVYFWRLLAVIIIGLAVCIQLAREFSPLLDRLRPDIESYLSEALNAEVSMGRLSATWEDLRPQLIVRDVAVTTPQGTTTLSVTNANLQINILQSMLNWRPVWQHVVLDNVFISGEQDPQGNWNLSGFRQADSKEGTSSQTSRRFDPADLFVLSQRVALSKASIQLKFRNGKASEVVIPTISIQNDGDFHRLVAKAGIDDSQDAFYFVLEGIGNPRDRQNFDASGFLKLNQFAIDKVIDVIPANTDALKASPWYQQQHLDARLWIDFTEPNRFAFRGELQLSGDSSNLNNESINLSDDSSAEDSPPWQMSSLSTQLVGDVSLESSWQLGLRRLQVGVGSAPLSIDQLSIYSEENKYLHLGLVDLDLAQWSDWLNRAFPSQTNLLSVVNELAVTGAVEQLKASIDLQNPALSTVKANLRDVDVKAWNNVPAFDNISGYVEAASDHGAVYLDAPGFHLHPQAIYEKPMVFDKAKGQVAWFLRSSENSIVINSGLLSVDGEFGHGRGYFFIDVPWVPKSRPGEFILQIGVTDSSAEHYQQFVPNVLPEDLRNWMDKSIISGDIKRAGFFYRGRFTPELPTERTVQLFADIANAELNYSDEWPRLTALNGTLVIDNGRVNATVDTAKLNDIDITRATVNWPDQTVANRRLLINGNASAKAAAGLALFETPWLSRKVGDAFEGWRTRGDITAQVSLAIPLIDQTLESDQSININFVGNDLYLTQQDLSFNNLQGQFTYDSRKGFSSNKLRANLWGQPLSLIAGDKNLKGSARTDYLKLSAEGKVGIKSVADWLSEPLLRFAEGITDYSAKLSIPLKDSIDEPSRLTVNSNLNGIDIDLPAPFAKTKAELKPLALQFSQLQRWQLEATIDRDFKLYLQEQPKSKVSGFFVANRPNYIHQDNPYFSVVGDVEFADSDQWLAVYDRYETFQKAYEGNNKSNASAGDEEPLNLRVDLLFKELQLAGHQLDDLVLNATRGKNDWGIRFKNDQASGDMRLPDDENVPIKAAFNYFSWPNESSTTGNDDGESVQSEWDNLDVSEWRPIDIDIKNFYYGKKPLGELRFKLRPEDNGLVASDIFAGHEEFSVSALKKHKGATLRWMKTASGHATSFSGTLRAKNLNDFLTQFDLPPLLETKSARIRADVSWQGSPDAFAVENLTGDLDIKMKDGRFIKGEGSGTTDILRLIGLFNFDTWARRIRLDFSDLYKTGLSFDDINGQLEFADGIIYLAKPLEVKGPSSRLKMGGTIDYRQQQLDTVLVATLPVGGNLTVVTALAAGLPAAAGVYLVSKIFRKQVDRVASLRYRMQGSWDNPSVEFEKLFDQDTTTTTADDGTSLDQGNSDELQAEETLSVDEFQAE